MFGKQGSNMNIAIGADHRGFECKTHLKQYVVGIDDPIIWIDVGTMNDERVDYPPYATAVVDALKRKEADIGILICGSGVGMAVVANRYHGMFAGVAWNEEISRLSKEHDKTNILVIPSDFVSLDQAVAITNAWLKAEFKGGRYQERIDMINALKLE